LKTCRRHTNGFARKDNLNEHCRRVHPTGQLQFNGNSKRHYPRTPETDLGNESLGDSVHSNQDIDSSSREPSKNAITGSAEGQALEAKLQELKEERERRLKDLDLKSLDKDIAAVERTLKLVKPATA
jgi:hypothetical protein